MLVLEVPVGYITGLCYFVHCLYLNVQGSQWMLECRVYVELPVTLDASFECYFFYLPLNLKSV